MSASLTVVMYHYVRDLPRTRFPRIKGLLTADFRKQLGVLGDRYEMATLASALDFLAGKYQPRRDLCLLTFDDGLKDHFTDVLPGLAERRIEGMFFLHTSCLEENRVAPVHKNHFLMAALEFAEYRAAFLKCLAKFSPETKTDVDTAKVADTYRFDSKEVGAFKFLINFCISEALRDQILDALFAEYLGSEQKFARELYLSWDEARQMQDAGMLMGGHSHSHTALANLCDAGQRADLDTCARLLHGRLKPQALWPFSYPYGKKHTFNALTIETVRKLGFACAFVTDVGSNAAGHDLFRLLRIDANDVH